MKLDDILGVEGSFESLVLAVTFEGRKAPFMTQGEWEPSAANSEWPSAGQWCIVNVVWADNPENNISSQTLYFKDRIMYWGVGICDVLGSYDLLSDFPNTKIWEFLTQYQIEQMRIDLPVELSEPFLKIGFEASEQNPQKLIAKIEEGCKTQQWIEWVKNGSDPALEPEWRK